MTPEIGIAYESDDGRWAGLITGLTRLDDARAEALRGLRDIYPTAARVVLFEGRSPQDGRIVEEIYRRRYQD